MQLGLGRKKWFAHVTDQGLTWLLLFLALALVFVAFTDNRTLKLIIAAWVILP
jgi:hypothetical protein